MWFILPSAFFYLLSVKGFPVCSLKMSFSNATSVWKTWEKGADYRSTELVLQQEQPVKGLEEGHVAAVSVSFSSGNMKEDDNISSCQGLFTEGWTWRRKELAGESQWRSHRRPKHAARLFSRNKTSNRLQKLFCYIPGDLSWYQETS